MKQLSYGDSLNTNYNGLNTEMLVCTDTVSARDINRPISNLYENEEDFYNLLQSIAKTIYGNKNGIIPDVYESFRPDRVMVGNFLDNENEWYLRVPTGLAVLKKQETKNNFYKQGENNYYDELNTSLFPRDNFYSYTLMNRPNVELYERELANIINLDLTDLDNDIKLYCEASQDEFIKYRLEVSRVSASGDVEKTYFPPATNNNEYHIYYPENNAEAIDDNKVVFTVKRNGAVISSIEVQAKDSNGNVYDHLTFNNNVMIEATLNEVFSNCFKVSEETCYSPYYYYKNGKILKYYTESPLSLGLFEDRNCTIASVAKYFNPNSTYYVNVGTVFTDREKYAKFILAGENGLTLNLYNGTKKVENINLTTYVNDTYTIGKSEVSFHLFEAAVDSGDFSNTTPSAKQRTLVFKNQGDYTLEVSEAIFLKEEIKKVEQTWYNNIFDLSNSFFNYFSDNITTSNGLGEILTLEPILNISVISPAITYAIVYDASMNGTDVSKRFKLVNTTDTNENYIKILDNIKIGNKTNGEKYLTSTPTRALPVHDKKTIYTKRNELNTLNVDTRTDLQNWFTYSDNLRKIKITDTSHNNSSGSYNNDTIYIETPKLEEISSTSVISTSPLITLRGNSNNKNKIELKNSSNELILTTGTRITSTTKNYYINVANSSSGIIDVTSDNLNYFRAPKIVLYNDNTKTKTSDSSTNGAVEGALNRRTNNYLKIGCLEDRKDAFLAGNLDLLDSLSIWNGTSYIEPVKVWFKKENGSNQSGQKTLISNFLNTSGASLDDSFTGVKIETISPDDKVAIKIHNSANNEDFEVNSNNIISRKQLLIPSISEITDTYGYSDPFVIGVSDNKNLVITKDAIRARNNGAASGLYLNYSGGEVLVGTNSKTAKLTIGKSGNSVVVDSGSITADVNASIGGTLSVAKETTLSGTLSVAKETTLSDALSVAKETTLSDTLSVAKETTLSDTLSVAKETTLSSTLEVTGATTLKDVANLESNTIIGIKGYEDTENSVTIDTKASTLEVVGNVTIGVKPDTSDNKTYTPQASTLTVVGITYLENNLEVTGATTLSDTLSVAKETTLSSTLEVTGATTLSSTLSVTGTTTLSSTLTVGNASNNIYVDSGNITATGVGTFSSVSTTSLRSKKTDIEELKCDATKLINDIQTVSFVFKDDETKEKHYGFIADDTNEIFSGPNKNTMRVNDCVGMLLKAVQELSNRISKLENGVD